MHRSTRPALSPPIGQMGWRRIFVHRLHGTPQPADVCKGTASRAPTRWAAARSVLPHGRCQQSATALARPVPVPFPKDSSDRSIGKVLMVRHVLHR
ncbi:hypothetical protein SZ55_4448 [Pseudomonas sp. FeS53a]|nr:hypothetical protein SZ55_4448 [Pseudomonas sp. FeS53a]